MSLFACAVQTQSLKFDFFSIRWAESTLTCNLKLPSPFPVLLFFWQVPHDISFLMKILMKENPFRDEARWPEIISKLIFIKFPIQFIQTNFFIMSN